MDSREQPILASEGVAQEKSLGKRLELHKPLVPACRKHRVTGEVHITIDFRVINLGLGRLQETTKVEQQEVEDGSANGRRRQG
jgi:CobQ-like glutamine amidotransferase family enzyme